MSGFLDVLHKSKKFYLESLKDDINARKDKDFFWPTGMQVYCGRQGSGKTISAIYGLFRLKIRYPKSIVVSNIKINALKQIPFKTAEELNDILTSEKFDPKKHYIFFDDLETLSIALVGVNNDKMGVIYVIDEIHTYFNALDSKNIPMYVFTEISQQRKQRKLIIGTSQLFLRVAKPLREQCDTLIICNTIMGFFTYQRAYDGMTLEQDYDGTLKGTLKKTGWFFHNRKIRNIFDTYQKVVSGSEQYETLNKIQIVDKKGRKIY